jgi:hypothetical protein
MSKIITVMLALAIAALAKSAHAATWENFGADPAYPSREAAIADAPRVMRQAGYPEQVVSLLTEAMKKPGVETHVTNGMKLDFMRSGRSALWRNVLVKFKKPPREASMEYSAPSEEWTAEWNGTKWTIGIPRVCNNTYGKPVSEPVAPKPTAVAPTPVVATGACPNGYTLVANAWSESSLSAVLHEKFTKLVAVANSRDTQQATNAAGYKGDGVSRTLGGQLRREVRTRAQVTTDVLVMLRDPKTFVAVQARVVIRLMDGVGSMTLSGDQVGMIVETIWPANFTSPTLSGGERRLWLFPGEWGSWCTMNVHGLVP